MYPTLPESEPDVQLSYVSLPTATGDVTAVLPWPTAPGTYPAVVVGAGAWGLTSEMVDVARRLAGQGYVTIMPDYLRGEGFGDTDHDDMPRLMRFIDSLDFRRASDDLFAGASHLAGLDPSQPVFASRDP
ncbi:dienelactone hydrolase family protein [Frankia tisae]|uniref:dienelactone hydrolase family protein n=1 Tax=Frankia tisae TaxID=2950104 RepID=UPI0021C016F7|nr:dienelactone hydrolase family protein [Frankia tisae]